MKRWTVSLVAMLLAALVGLSACSDDSGDGDADADPESTSTSVDDGTAADDDDGETTTTTGDGEGDDLAAVAEALEGTWTGTWSNTTFGSTGPATLTLAVDADAGTMDVNADLGGNVFGAPDPDAESFTVPLDSTTFSGTSSTLGDYEATFADGTITVTASPAVFGPESFTATIEIDGDTATGTYTITTGGETYAEGTFEAAKG